MSALLLIGPLGPFEILIILFVGLLIFGARLPEVGRSLGKGLMEFKRGLRGMQDEMHDIDREADRQVDEELERRALPTNPAEENAALENESFEDDLAPYDPRFEDENATFESGEEDETDEVYEDDPTQEPGPEFGGDPQPDADPPSPSSSSDDGTIVYADPEYLDSEEKPDP